MLRVPFAILGVFILVAGTSLIATSIIRRRLLLRERLLARAEETIVELNEANDAVPPVAVSVTRTPNGPLVFGNSV